MRASDADDLIDAGAVAEILGLRHRNSVSTYRSRYPDFPPGMPSPLGGRGRVWRRGDIVAWHRTFAGRTAPAEAQDGSPRLDDLVDATLRLILANPGTDIGIRQIAAEAGMAHSDLYRYAESKEQLLRLAMDRATSEFTFLVPDTLDEFEPQLGAMTTALLQRRAGLRVLVDEMISNPDAPLRSPLSAAKLIPIIEEIRARESIVSPVAPEALAAFVASMLIGFTVLESRWRQGLGLDHTPVEELAHAVAQLLRA